MGRYLRHVRGIASRLIGEEVVIVSPRVGKVWSLNQAGALLWELADGSRDEAALASELGAARGADAAGCREELAVFADEMVARGLLQWSELPAAQAPRSVAAAGRLQGRLEKAAAVVREEELQVLASACVSGHSGQGAACMVFGSCLSGFS